MHFFHKFIALSYQIFVSKMYENFSKKLFVLHSSKE